MFICDILNVFLNQVGVGTAVHKYLLDPGVRKELKSIFDQRCIGEREETLLRTVSASILIHQGEEVDVPEDVRA